MKIDGVMREMVHLYARLERERPTWEVQPLPENVRIIDPTALSYAYSSDNCRVLVIEFSVGGARGYDGTVAWADRGFVMRLPREWCEKFMGLAKSKARER